MLDIDSGTVCRVIERCREFHAKEGVTIPYDAEGADADWARQVLADHEGDLTLAELKALINDLEPDQQMNLVALMWIGRGDFEAGEWDAALQQARDEWTPRTAEYLVSTPLVADYLNEAIEQMGYSCTNDAWQ